MMDGDLSWGGEPTIECTDDVLNCAPETGTILLISITPINSRKKGKKKEKKPSLIQERVIFIAFKKWGKVKEKEGWEIFNDSGMQITGFEIYLRKNLRFVKIFY